MDQDGDGEITFNEFADVAHHFPQMLAGNGSNGGEEESEVTLNVEGNSDGYGGGGDGGGGGEAVEDASADEIARLGKKVAALTAQLSTAVASEQSARDSLHEQYGQ